GYDVHRFEAGRPLILGGVRIPSPVGLLGHSDADVLLHAVCDALLGAAALGDIGIHFPNTSKRYRNISSIKLLAEVVHLLRSAGFRILNVDCTVILERPKLAPFVPAMVTKIGKTLKLDPGCVSVKATTNEGMGFVGRNEGCGAFAVAALEQVRR
ncbi:MAG: 2-C-methyl-D-erythritol 2,4-cyclodiphosphate synthase, partial [Bacteroidota bacterium]